MYKTDTLFPKKLKQESLSFTFSIVISIVIETMLYIFVYNMA